MIKKIVKVGAEWCAPCKAFDPVFDQVAQMPEFVGIEFSKVDAEKDEDFVDRYNIRHLPMVLALDEQGNAKYQFVGAVGINILREKLLEWKALEEIERTI